MISSSCERRSCRIVPRLIVRSERGEDWERGSGSLSVVGVAGGGLGFSGDTGAKLSCLSLL